MEKIRPDMDVGKNIQRLRYAAHLTQDQTLARLQLMGITISKSTYAKLETNRMNIKISELVALSEIFQAEIGEFFAGLRMPEEKVRKLRELELREKQEEEQRKEDLDSPD